MNGNPKDPGFRQTTVIDGHEITITARHTRARRMPRPHQMVQQMSRGRPVSMVEEVHYEWTISAPNGQTGVLKPNPNGTYYLSSSRQSYRTFNDAAAAYAKSLKQKNNLTA